MKIDLDCVRDLMLCAEANTGLHQRCCFLDYAQEESAKFVGELSDTPSYQVQLENQYENETLLYHLKYCVESGLLAASTPTGIYQVWISDLTPKGHDFLANTRNNNSWGKVKYLASKSGSTAVDFVIDVGKTLASETLKSLLLKGI